MIPDTPARPALPPEATPEWTEQDERELQRNAALSDPWCLDQSMVFFIRRYAREIRRLRSEREAQDAEIAKLTKDRDDLRDMPCGVCLGNPLVSGALCICGGIGTEQAEMMGLRSALFDAEEELESLRSESAASVPNTGTAREIDAEQVRGICAKIDTIDSSWTDDRYTYVRVGELRLLSNALVGYRPSSAPSRGSDSDGVPV